MHTVLVNVGLVPVPLFSFAPDPTGLCSALPLSVSIGKYYILSHVEMQGKCGGPSKFSWLMYEIVLKYACPVSDIIAEDFLFMRIQLSEHFTYRKLLRFTLPSVIMMVCTSIYGVVDGVFVSNFVGSDAFAAVNLIMPFLMVLGAVSFMLGTGGSALVAYTLGAGNEKRANEIFSLLIYVLIGLGAVFTIGGIAFLTPMSRLLGADETMLPVCVSYGRIVLLGLIPYMLQNTFQSFLVTAERPQLGLYVTIAAGVTINRFTQA